MGVKSSSRRKWGSILILKENADAGKRVFFRFLADLHSKVDKFKILTGKKSARSHLRYYHSLFVAILTNEIEIK